MPDFCPRQARATDPSQAEPVEATEAAEAAGGSFCLLWIRDASF